MHIPVLVFEALECLNVRPNCNYIDATVDGGGHAQAILEKNAPAGKVLGIDWDEKILEDLKGRTADLYYFSDRTENTRQRQGRLILHHGNFADLEKIVAEESFGPIHGLLLDLGLSSFQLEESGRGFSFQKDEPLLMNYDLANPLTAEKIINTWSIEAIEKILREYGEERFAAAIAREVDQTRRQRTISSTFELNALVCRATPIWYQRRRIQPATKTFQALRIAVNDELGNLERILLQAPKVLAPAGRVVVISFHSLEDRLVKNFFRAQAEKEQLTILTKKPIRPTQSEIKSNPRARSARLRAAEKL